MFHVELLSLQKPSLIQLPTGNGLYTVAGVVAVIGLLGYELYKRAKSESDGGGKTKKTGGKRKKGKR